MPTRFCIVTPLRDLVLAGVALFKPALGVLIKDRDGISVLIQKLQAAGAGDAGALKEVEDILVAWAQRRSEAGRPSTGQDMLKGRRTEIDFINGLVVEKGQEMGIKTPYNAAITALVKRVESGVLKPNPENLSGIQD